jgi:predicted MFS family arabinose efflux permease
MNLPLSNTLESRARLTSSHYTLLILTLIYSCNVFDRTILGILLEPIRKEYGLSDSQLGLLSGLAFAIFYTIAGLPLGILADRANRRNMMAACLAVWSGMTLVCGLAQSFVQLLLARIGVGIGEGGSGPAATSMIADLYPPGRRATAIATFYLASPVGAFLALAAGGRIAAHYGWRWAFLAGGIPGLLLVGLLLLTVKEPRRGQTDPKLARPEISDHSPPRSTAQSLRFFWFQRSLVYVIAGMTLQTFVVSGIGAWIASFFVRSHGFGLAQIGPILGFIIGGCGLIGTLSGGLIVDRLAQRDERWRPWTLAIASAVTAPLFMVTLVLPDSHASLAAFALGYAFSAVWYGPALGLCQSLVGARMRGTVTAVTYLSMNLIGYGLGVQSIGLLSDLFARRFGTDSLRYALFAAGTLDILAALCFLLAARTLRRDLSTAAAT